MSYPFRLLQPAVNARCLMYGLVMLAVCSMQSCVWLVPHALFTFETTILSSKHCLL